MACFWVKFTSQKSRCICISVTDHSVSSREGVSSIYVGICKTHRISCVGKLQSGYQVVGPVTTLLETLIL